MQWLAAYDRETVTLLSVWRLRDGDLEWWENPDFRAWNYQDLFHKVRNLHMPWDEIGYQYMNHSGYTTYWIMVELDAEAPEEARQEILSKGIH